MINEIGGHGLTGGADAAAFLGRLTRIAPGALVRLRASRMPGYTELWARLPWAVLVSRTVSGDGPGEATVPAAALLAELASGGSVLPARRDAGWRFALPPSAGRVVETLSGVDVHRLAVAAAQTLRTATVEGVRGRAVGQRMLRDALLDHVAVVVTEPVGGPSDHPPTRIEVSQRLVQAVVRMGFLGQAPGPVDPGDNCGDQNKSVQIRLIGPWVGLSAPYGVAWLRSADQSTLTPTSTRTNG